MQGIQSQEKGAGRVKTNFKPDRVIEKVRRHIQRRKRVNAEDAIMRAVRQEDGYCRFPMCGCRRMRLPIEAAHAGKDGHRGSGGNPDGSRTTPENLIGLCRPRHRAHRFSVDKKTLRPVPQTDLGMRGPVWWLIDITRLPSEVVAALSLDVFSPSMLDGTWFRVAQEIRPHHFEPFTWQQTELLKLLAKMEC